MNNTIFFITELVRVINMFLSIFIVFLIGAFSSLWNINIKDFYLKLKNNDNSK
jgi:hypothetical protein